MTPAVTVIVPVYNVGQYIGRCAESLFKQTLESLEILFIDDCSPDLHISKNPVEWIDLLHLE